LPGQTGDKEETVNVHEVTRTALGSSTQLGRQAERALVQGPALGVTRRPLGAGVVNLGRQSAEPAPANGAGRRDAAAGNGQAGQEFSDLLLVGSTASRCPLAIVTVLKGDAWSTLSFGAEREALDDPELFAIIAGRREPVEVTDPATNPALARCHLAHSGLGIRWLLGVPLIGPSGDVTAIFAVLDTEPRELSRRERAAMVALGRLISTALSAHRGPDHIGPPPAPPERAGGTRQVIDGQSLLRSHEVAALFDVTERTVINWAAAGKLPCLRTVGGHLRFRTDEVMSLLEANSLRRPQGVS